MGNHQSRNNGIHPLRKLELSKSFYSGNCRAKQGAAVRFPRLARETSGVAIPNAAARPEIPLPPAIQAPAQASKATGQAGRGTGKVSLLSWASEYPHVDLPSSFLCPPQHIDLGLGLYCRVFVSDCRCEELKDTKCWSGEARQPIYTVAGVCLKRVKRGCDLSSSSII